MRAVNGIETTFQPDERNRLKQISSLPLTLTYAYTPGGNVASITDASYGEPFTITYGYHGANRLISAEVHMPTGIETVQYVYDALGNRIKEAWTDARGAIDYSYLPGNYLVQRGSTSYSWGTYGQLILKDEQPNVLGGETNYDYNARRLMTQVRVDGSPVAQYFYDPYGRRVKIVEGDTTTITLYSGNDIVYEVKTKPGQPMETTKYLAINGKYLAKVVQDGTNPPQAYFYHTDLVGSVRAITDGQGQVVARFEYEPFGVTVAAHGSLAAAEVHRFTGKREDRSVELYYFNFRYYLPLVGRFTSRDPVDGSYAYCRGNPLIYRDMTGAIPTMMHDGPGGVWTEEDLRRARERPSEMWPGYPYPANEVLSAHVIYFPSKHWVVTEETIREAERLGRYADTLLESLIADMAASRLPVRPIVKVMLPPISVEYLQDKGYLPSIEVAAGSDPFHVPGEYTIEHRIIRVGDTWFDIREYDYPWGYKMIIEQYNLDEFTRMQEYTWLVIYWSMHGEPPEGVIVY